MLSPLDRELLTEWAQVGAPFEVVARGIRKAAEKVAYDARPGSSLRSLRACKREVDSEIKKFLARSAGASAQASTVGSGSAGAGLGGTSLEAERAARVGKVLRSLSSARPELSSACAVITARLASAASSRHLDDLVLLRLAKGLSLSERRKLSDEARRAAAQGGISLRARKLSFRVHRAAAIRRALDLPAFW